MANNSRRVLIVAGGEWQVPLTRKVRKMGLFTLSSNQFPDSPAFAHADATLVADVRDKAANLAFAREHHVDAVITDQSDVAVPTVAYVCDQLGLPGIGGPAAELFTNKARMREFCAAHGFATPRFHVCRSPEEAARCAEAFGYPCVIKPTASQASRGVIKVDHASDIGPAFAEATRNSPDGLVLIEQFIGGVELTVEGLKLAAGHFSLAVSRKSHYARNPMVARRLLYSPGGGDIDYARLRSQCDRMVNAMGLAFGLTHAEFKYDRGEFYLVEIAARGGGTRISSDIVPLMSGIDTNELLIRSALGEDVSIGGHEHPHRCVALDFWDFPPGRVRAVGGLEAVRAMPDVVAAYLKLGPGDMVGAVGDDTQRHGCVIAWANDQAALERRLAEIRATIHIDYEKTSTS